MGDLRARPQVKWGGGTSVLHRGKVDVHFFLEGEPEKDMDQKGRQELGGGTLGGQPLDRAELLSLQ